MGDGAGAPKYDGRRGTEVKLEERVSGTRHVHARHLCTSLPSELL